MGNPERTQAATDRKSIFDAAELLNSSPAGRSAIRALAQLFRGPGLDCLNQTAVKFLIEHHFGGYGGTTLDAVATLAGSENVKDWLNASDEMPDTDECVLVASPEEEEPFIAAWDGKRFEQMIPLKDYPLVTHWRPLPKTPHT